ncbi:cell number regulator 4 isoform X1 [Zea mays]|uniref:cell number regulator 4 isoform X1 n=1 Tax=Zea mays TaxID=4577 RepID=UPI000182F0D5|nr:cell number regulator 4 isoform X1 [Zea mays]ONM62335.1 Protein PLANT CADMIUM RESISTANCE 12 [Zea mays]|eukprot:XP_008646733.1 cell number regulator 4 isoform X1 [Zea mays]
MSTYPPPTGEWTTGLCGCFSDCKSCCLSFLCPCIPFGQVAEVLDKGMTSCGLAGLLYCLLLHAGVAVVPCHCIYTCTYRRKLRAAYDLPPEPCADCCVHMWCGPCAISQMYRELKNRGADPAMGWEVLSKKTTMAPVPMQDMTR